MFIVKYSALSCWTWNLPAFYYSVVMHGHIQPNSSSSLPPGSGIMAARVGDMQYNTCLWLIIGHLEMSGIHAHVFIYNDLQKQQSLIFNYF